MRHCQEPLEKFPLTLETLENLYLPWDPTDGLQYDGGSIWVLHTQAVLPPMDTGLTVPSGHTSSPLCARHHPHRRWYLPAEEAFHILQKTWKKAERLAGSVVVPKHPVLTFGQKG